MSKVCQFHKLLALMVDGKVHSMVEIEKALAKAGVASYRLPAYLWDIKKYAGGTIEVAEREGRRVTAYRLTNPEHFKDFVLGEFEPSKSWKAPRPKRDSRGHFIPRAKVAAAAKRVRAKKVNKVAVAAGPSEAVEAA